MLILIRKSQQGFVMSGGISVRVLEVLRDRMKLGIDAPSSVRVLRDELIGDAAGDPQRESSRVCAHDAPAVRVNRARTRRQPKPECARKSPGCSRKKLAGERANCDAAL